MPTGINKKDSGIEPPDEVKPIPSWPGYGATVDGRIWSYRNKVYRKTRLMKRGYLRVNLSLNNQIKDRYVHQLVAEAWLPNPHCLPMINHKDGNKRNNAVSNLERCTAQHNIRHSLEYGLHPRGEKSSVAKLTLANVHFIRKSNQHSSYLGPKLGVSETTIRDVRTRRSWKHVT